MTQRNVTVHTSDDGRTEVFPMDPKQHRKWRDLLGADEERLVATGECRLIGADGGTLDPDADIPPGAEPLELRLSPRRRHHLLVDEIPSLVSCPVLVIPAKEEYVPAASAVVRSFQWNGIPCTGVRPDREIENLATTYGSPDATACGVIAVGRWLNELTDLRQSWSASKAGRGLLLGCMAEPGWRIPADVAVACLPSFAEVPAAEGDVLAACREMALSFGYDAACYQYPLDVRHDKGQREIEAIRAGFLHWGPNVRGPNQGTGAIREGLRKFVGEYLQYLQRYHGKPLSNAALRRLVMESSPMGELCDQARIDPVKERVPMKKVFELCLATQAE